MLERIKKPWVIMGIASILYNVLEMNGVKIPQDQFRLIIDLLSYLILGIAVYTDHGTGN